MPWRIAAGENRFVRVDAERAAAGLDRDLEGTRWGLGARHVLGILGLFCSRTPDFALKPKPPRRVARALSPRARADRRLRRCRHARGAAAAGRVRLLALTSTPGARAGAARGRHHPLLGNLDDRPRCAGWRAWPRAWCTWRRRPAKATCNGGATCARAPCCAPCARRPRRRLLVYGSTSGVYGDCGGEMVAETRAAAPAHAARAAPRRCGERRCATTAARRACGPASCASPASTRPTAKAARRANGCCRARRCCAPSDDVYTNHIHADDLARACVAALWRGKPQRVYNASDDSELKMGDYFDLAADLYGLPRPPRVPRDDGAGRVAARAAEFHGGVAPARQRAPEARTAAAAALSDGGGRGSRRAETSGSRAGTAARQNRAMPTTQLSVYFFLQVAAIIAICQLVGRLGQSWVGQPQVVGEMIAGVVLGPSLFGLLFPELQRALFPQGDASPCSTWARQFGVGLYMFLVGTEFRARPFPEPMRKQRGFGVGGGHPRAVRARRRCITPWLLRCRACSRPRHSRWNATLFLGAAIAHHRLPDAGADHQRTRPRRDRRSAHCRLTAGAFDDACAWCVLAIVLATFGGGPGVADARDRRRRRLCAVHGLRSAGDCSRRSAAPSSGRGEMSTRCWPSRWCCSASRAFADGRDRHPRGVRRLPARRGHAARAVRPRS